MNAAPAVQQQLLELQGLDSVLDRLAQRRRTLPAIAEIESLDQRLTMLRDHVVMAQTQIGDIAREERRIETDVDVVRSRIAKDQQRLDTGAVNSPRELENLQHELLSLARRRGDLEDLELEQMEAREVAETTLRGLQAEVDELTSQRQDAEARRDAEFVTIDRDVAKANADRSLLAPQLPADLIALYEKIRAGSAGIGAALLRGTRCEGCRLSLSPMDVNRIRTAPEDEIVRCEECLRILIRAPATAAAE
ncbi:MAG: C4-type zinc ribbon domain-containing protein [Actinomycetota bacterium]